MKTEEEVCVGSYRQRKTFQLRMLDDRASRKAADGLVDMSAHSKGNGRHQWKHTPQKQNDPTQTKLQAHSETQETKRSFTPVIVMQDSTNWKCD